MNMDVMKAMPEFISRKDMAPQPWKVEEGAPVRGDAWTNMRAAQMRVPYGADELSRSVRAHEMMHAKVSPSNNDSMRALPVSFDCIMAAEEFRVNSLIASAGFDADALRDGSESQSGKILGQNGDWNGIVRMVASTAGTKACADLLRGLKQSSPELALRAREVQKVLKREWKKYEKRYGTSGIASTRDKDGLPLGFVRVTIPLAQFLQRIMTAEQGAGEPDPNANPDLPDVADIARGKSKQFARLIEKELTKSRVVDGKLGRKRIACNIGKNPRRINRMLTDPERRIFDRRAKGKGGVVLIDQSGSMQLSEQDIHNLIESAPGCTIVGYSHSIGSTDIPNTWVIADKGRVADEIPDGNGGNGVDGPAIRFSLNKRKSGEPFIWVCDGYVTAGEDDDYYQNLGEECASLVVKHGIHMVHDMKQAVSALKIASNGHRLETKAVGYITKTEAWRNYAIESC